MPDDPGAPRNTDEQNVSPDEVEQAADRAAGDDLLTTQPDPSLPGGEEDTTKEGDLA